MSSQKNKIHLVRRHDLKWEGALDDDEKKLSKFGIGEVVLFQYTLVREYINLKRYFLMIQIGFQNQEDYMDEDDYRDAVQMEAGYFREVTLWHNGEKLSRRWPKSISYEKCTEKEFVELQEKVSEVISKKLGIQEKELQEEIIRLGYSHG